MLTNSVCKCNAKVWRWVRSLPRCASILLVTSVFNATLLPIQVWQHSLVALLASFVACMALVVSVAATDRKLVFHLRLTFCR